MRHVAPPYARHPRERGDPATLLSRRDEAWHPRLRGNAEPKPTSRTARHHPASSSPNCVSSSLIQATVRLSIVTA
ncbi:hypothetical protein [Lysobacter gummosus]|uniref:hypothetical protein n=1 Tax=Lysobacter gummosus TaxID=262324 RepID=UPI003638FDB9